MGTSDPFSCSQSFTDLLTSQQEASFPDIFSQPHSPQTQTNSPREYRTRWTLPEEKVLVSAWLNTSKDSIVGNEQKAGAFWKRVAAYYAAAPSVANLPIRESNTCKQKWSKLNESVSKFAGCYEFASRHKSSGQSEDDVLEVAYKLYFQDHKTKFTLEHAWRLLRNDQKWCSLSSSKGNTTSKRTKLNDEGSFSSNSNRCSHVEEESMDRPIGVKAAKSKGKKRVKGVEESEGSSVKELEELWNIKEKDMAIKERLANKKLLGDLLSKVETLSEIEETLKKKLICEML